MRCKNGYFYLQHLYSHQATPLPRSLFWSSRSSSCSSPQSLLWCSLFSIMDLKAEYKLCLNDQVVPVEEQDISFVDPYNLATELDLNLDDMQHVKLVNFRAGHLVWLEKALQLPSRSLHRSLQKLPLFQEIKELIGTIKNRNKKGPNARAATEWKSLIPLKVRNRLLFVRNTTHCVVLGLLGSDGGVGPDEEAETLVWFTNQVHEDLKIWEKAAGPSKALSSASSQVFADHQEEVEEVLEVLKQHSACQNAWWAPSRHMITVLKKNSKERKEIRVQGLTKNRKTQEGFERPWNSFQKALALGIEYLDSEVPEQSSSSASGHPTKIQQSMNEDAEGDIEEDEKGQPST